MKIDFQLWAKVYEKQYENEIVYNDKNGKTKVEKSPLFKTISKDLQEKGYLTKKDFVNICMWKTQRQRTRYESNPENEVQKATKNVICLKQSVEDKVRELTQLSGVGVPVATAIMSVLFPNKYCIVDYRSCRAFLWATSETLNLEEYSELANLLDKFRNYSSLRFYGPYLDEIRKLSVQWNMTPREIEMALWKYDEQGGNLGQSY